MLINHLPKTARNMIFVLGLSMVTMAGAIQQVESRDLSFVASYTAQCPNSIPAKVIAFLAS